MYAFCLHTGSWWLLVLTDPSIENKKLIKDLDDFACSGNLHWLISQAYKKLHVFLQARYLVHTALSWTEFIMKVSAIFWVFCATLLASYGDGNCPFKTIFLFSIIYLNIQSLKRAMESSCDRGETRQRRQSYKKQTLKIDKDIQKLNIKESMMTENIFVSKKNRSVTDAIFLFVSLERECFVSFF